MCIIQGGDLSEEGCWLSASNVIGISPDAFGVSYYADSGSCNVSCVQSRISLSVSGCLSISLPGGKKICDFYRLGLGLRGRMLV